VSDLVVALAIMTLDRAYINVHVFSHSLGASATLVTFTTVSLTMAATAIRVT
jgi:hypothetical protein